MNKTKGLNWHIIGLSEVRRPGEKLVETKEKYLFYHKEKYIVKQSEVGFLVHKDLTPKVKVFNGV